MSGPERKEYRRRAQEYVPGKNPHRFCTQEGNMERGIYAPMRKPTAVEKIETMLAMVASVLTNEQRNTVNSVEEAVV